jgi:hypothetical protein
MIKPKAGDYVLIKVVVLNPRASSDCIEVRTLNYQNSAYVSLEEIVKILPEPIKVGDTVVERNIWYSSLNDPEKNEYKNDLMTVISIAEDHAMVKLGVHYQSEPIYIAKKLSDLKKVQ